MAEKPIKYKVIKLKRLFNNVASTRDYITKECVYHAWGIRFELAGKDEYMELSPEEVTTKAFQLNKAKQSSRFGGKDYYLIDYAWRPTKPQETPSFKQEELF